jgi:hypothetical protein
MRGDDESHDAARRRVRREAMEKIMGAINQIAGWEVYQGDGGSGPFGYLDGWFVNWSLDAEGKLRFELDADQHYDGDDEPMSKQAAERFVAEWLEREMEKESSRVIAKISAECISWQQQQ